MSVPGSPGRHPVTARQQVLQCLRLRRVPRVRHLRPCHHPGETSAGEWLFSSDHLSAIKCSEDSRKAVLQIPNIVSERKEHLILLIKTFN